MYKRFEMLLEEFHVTPYQVSKATKVARSTLSNWKNGNYTPKQEKIQKIAEYFNVSTEWLLGYNVPRQRYDTTINISEPVSVTCDIQIAPDKMQYLPEYMQKALDIFKTEDVILINNTPLDNQVKEKIISNLEHSIQEINTIYKELLH